MYIDGHEREDVVEYRKAFLKRMEQYSQRMATFSVVDGEVVLDMPTLKENEKLLILVTHDESTFYENDRKRQRWIAKDEKPVPQPKGEGSSIMVSDFISPNFGRLRDAHGEARLLFRAGRKREGYFNNDKLLEQIEQAITIFGRLFPDAQALFLFDNATTHQKRANDALSALHMPKSCKQWHPGGQPMHDGTFEDGTPQSFYWPNDHPKWPGYFKGMEQILRERGLYHDKLKAQCNANFSDCKDSTNCCCRRILFNQPDFMMSKSNVEELLNKHGHICDFYPKFHCELNFIEQYWGAAKYRYRGLPGTRDTTEMERNVTHCLDDVPFVQMQRYWIRSLRFMDAYAKGLTGAQAVWANKRYHGHRTLPMDIMETILANNVVP
ncbi:hypothetical protein CPB86DRAFT_878752 [Serendipita vermifera]|nr:hypothetical protein CPB86DRAFT_878752 [Serendipita vermifera]